MAFHANLNNDIAWILLKSKASLIGDTNQSVNLETRGGWLVFILAQSTIAWRSVTILFSQVSRVFPV